MINRNVISSLLIIGIIGAIASSSTLAPLNDTELSPDNLFETGGVDLKVGWNETYNGNTVETQAKTDLDTNPIITLEDVKPGDQGRAIFDLEAEGNPAWVTLTINATNDSEGFCHEPEHGLEPGHACTEEGELKEHLQLQIWYETNGNGRLDRNPPLPNEYTLPFPDMDSNFRKARTLIDGTPFEGYEPFSGEGRTLGVKWSVPNETGNDIMQDSLTLHLHFNAKQARHTDKPPELEFWPLPS